MNLINTSAHRTREDSQSALEKVGNTPMAPVQVTINGYSRTIYLKLEGHNPAGSSKDRTARALIEDMEAQNRLSSSAIVLESTSGNLGVALSVVCHAKGYPFVAVVDPHTTKEALQNMRALKTLIEMVSEPDHTGGYLKSRLTRVHQLLQSSSRYVWLDQYSNPANPQIHYVTTGPEIYYQMEGKVDAVFIAVSTGGTLAGVARYFREVSSKTTIVAVDAVGSVIFGGEARPRRLTGIGSARVSSFIEESHYDRVSMITDENAFSFCRRLFEKTGLKIGGSSGAVLAACIDYLTLRPGIKRAVCLCADRGENYDSTIFNDEWLAEKQIVLPQLWSAVDFLPFESDTFAATEKKAFASAK
jgi:N-(2-amino-2-carboxyethyl)-L-glutamate synthase